MLKLENFEQVLDPGILKKGRDYFKSGHVTDLEEMDEGGWSALVAGSYGDYEVEIVPDEDGSLNAYCNCPYEYGPYCKHVAAVLFAVRANKNTVQSVVVSDKQPKQNVRSVIEQLSREDLITLVMEQVKKDKALGNSILLRYSAEAPDKSMYVRVIQDSLRSGKGRDGFIDYMGARRAAAGVYKLLDEAEKLIVQNQVAKALPILQAVVETMPSALNEADDSDGELSGCIESAFNAFDDAVKVMSESEKRAFFDYCLEQAAGAVYRGWDYDWHFLWQASELVETPDQRRALFDLLDRKTSQLGGHHLWNNFRLEDALEIKLSVMERLGDDAQAVHDLLSQNIHLNKVRQRLIQQYIQQGKLNTARKLALEAIKQYENERLHGLVNQYRVYLLQIAQKENDPLAIQDLARDLFLQTQDFQFYDILKAQIHASEWPAYLQKLVQKMQTLPRWGGGEHLLAAVYAREQMWDNVLSLAQMHGLSIIERYRDELHRRYPAQIAVVYEQVVYRMLKDASGRDTYRQACECLRRMKTLGQVNRVQEIVQDLRTKYPRRSAMLQELDKV